MALDREAIEKVQRMTTQQLLSLFRSESITSQTPANAGPS
jgi:hypothetical protein